MRSKGRVFLVEWDAHAADEIASTLRAARWDVDVEYADGEAAYRRLAAAPPDVAVFSLSSRPSHGLATAKAFTAREDAADTTVIFLAAPDKPAVTATIPTANFTTPEGLLPALEALGIPERMGEVIPGGHDTELHEPPTHGIGAPEEPLDDPLSDPPEEV